jgi:hypothetical protein
MRLANQRHQDGDSGSVSFNGSFIGKSEIEAKRLGNCGTLGGWAKG